MAALLELTDDQWISKIQDREAGVRTLIRQNNTVQALRLSLQEPPVTSKNQDVKEKNAAVVKLVLESIPLPALDVTAGAGTGGAKVLKSHLDGLTPEDWDVLMKYLYRGLQAPDRHNCSALLRW
eukprot:CAMPEP_0113936388 /NCGR_PEP_ID=MMETSP1339-20121228/3318_1 /TAXON_ID=94617 /ORGANISM="Fibrocapsa japonica" /LENGTH=123 /DNA_ID=CAMNT_0000938855 /DNA_START=37 /DNA_END=405 /DNA_ORIENTATION=- /assembly_acc=CAM_ASM_000762